MYLVESTRFNAFLCSWKRDTQTHTQSERARERVRDRQSILRARKRSAAGCSLPYRPPSPVSTHFRVDPAPTDTKLVLLVGGHVARLAKNIHPCAEHTTTRQQQIPRTRRQPPRQPQERTRFSPSPTTPPPPPRKKTPCSPETRQTSASGCGTP